MASVLKDKNGKLFAFNKGGLFQWDIQYELESFEMLTNYLPDTCRNIALARHTGIWKDDIETGLEVIEIKCLD